MCAHDIIQNMLLVFHSLVCGWTVHLALGTAVMLLQECTAYCGPSDSVTALTVNGSSTDTGNGTITIQLPPATGDSYHCVVSGSRDDGTVVFRGRQQQTVRGEGT